MDIGELAGDRRLQEVGIKTLSAARRGHRLQPLYEYRHGDPVRHIDWKATLRLAKPVVREFQDERDQCVPVPIDCGRRMCADERLGGVGTAHFDRVLNAVMVTPSRNGSASSWSTGTTPPSALDSSSSP